MAFACLVVVLATILAIHNYQIIGTANAAVGIGVNYGMVGDNLPPSKEVINMYKQYNIPNMRLFDPNPNALSAVKGTQISLSLGVRNEDVPSIASSQAGADAWFTTNVQPYVGAVNIAYITLGNEIVPSEFAGSILGAMQNLQNTLTTHQLTNIKLTTVISMATLASSYPPSTGAFTPAAAAVMKGILGFLSQNQSPLMLNVYPYFAYASDPTDIRLDYAQFTAPGPVVHDGNLSYQNLFDAMVDAVFWAMESLGFNNVGLVVSESGWPSAGNGNMTTPALASVYNKNYLQHITSGVGTPKRPGGILGGYIFAMFNEDQKPAGVEQNWGLFTPDMKPVYPVFG
ncbi:hypothetical protein Tsubulata_012841 [Turnera subulata]|uniref:glucan endo-1,3-beta-D-glucosidase n=1 Tax=Turnera subulata TaxID=218843 RepID=A0A9Q0FP87_9ROSI|nr:hypothetical protein Tsubulata_012841 [Turnera subulata]